MTLVSLMVMQEMPLLNLPKCKRNIETITYKEFSCVVYHVMFVVIVTEKGKDGKDKKGDKDKDKKGADSEFFISL